MNLLKLLLVDDEAIILKGLSETYDWARMGFELVGTATDGDTAIDKIQELKPDVVLTDVRMKRMSGLELMKRSNEINENVSFVVISAYKDFEYAQTACREGALAYLVKPIDDEELEKTMSEVYAKCSDRIYRSETYAHWKRLLLEDKESYLHMMRGRYLNGGITEEEYVHIYKELHGSEPPGNRYIVVCADMDLSYKVISQSDYDAKRYVLISELTKKLAEAYPVETYNAPEVECATFIIRLEQKTPVQPLARILSQVKNELGYDIISAVSNEFYGAAGMRQAYNQALKLYHLALEAGAGMLTMPPKASLPDSTQYSIDIENQILASMRKNDAAGLKDSFTKFVYHLPVGEDLARIYIHRLVVRMEFWLGDGYDDIHRFDCEFQNFYEMLGKYTALRLVDMAFKLLSNILNVRRENIPEAAGEFFGDYMQVAVNYIDEHLHEEDLSITQVAGQIYLNPVYFGRVFKSVLGLSFKRYVLNARMERAKAMIIDDTYSIAAICEKVGIPNPSYFTKLFKQCTGQLPSEYKRNCASEESR